MRLPALALLGTIMLAGCSGGDDEPVGAAPAAPVASAVPTFVSSIPSPAADRVAPLRAALLDAVPRQTAEKAVSRARDTCSQIIGGVAPDRLVTSVITRFSDRSAELDAADAQKLIAIIKAEAWCK